jgi:hypothetical protein
MVYIIAAQRLCVISVECKLEIAAPRLVGARNDASPLSLRGALPLKGDVAIYLRRQGVKIAVVLHVSWHSSSEPSHYYTQQFASLVGCTIGQPFPPSFVTHNILSLPGKISQPVNGPIS